MPATSTISRLFLNTFHLMEAIGKVDTDKHAAMQNQTGQPLSQP